MFVKFETQKNGFIVPVNDMGNIDWLCPKCNHEHTSCCGNSHFPCMQSPQYGGVCNCDYDLLLNLPLPDDRSITKRIKQFFSIWG